MVWLSQIELTLTLKLFPIDPLLSFCHIFKAEWPNIRCVPIRNNNQGVSNIGKNRGRGRGSVLMQI